MTQFDSAELRPDEPADNTTGHARGATHLVVNEIFGPTIQGEGLSAGVPAIFLRLAGCPLSCSWCDTAYAWDWSRFDRSAEARPMDIESVWDHIIMLAADSGVSTLVVTGGEPASQARALQPLLERSRAAGWRSEMETSGSVDPSRIVGLLDLITVSPKTSNSAVPQEHRLRPAVLRTLASEPKAVWKFVVESDSDLDEIDDLVRTYDLNPVLLMAQATTRTESLERTRRLIPSVIARGYRVSPRLHVLLWGDERGR